VHAGARRRAGQLLQGPHLLTCAGSALPAAPSRIAPGRCRTRPAARAGCARCARERGTSDVLRLGRDAAAASAQDDLTPEMQAITRMMGALQAMQQLRWPAALGGGGDAHADAERGASEKAETGGAGGERGRGGASGERGRDGAGASGATERGQGGAGGEAERRGVGGGGDKAEQAAAREPMEQAGDAGGGGGQGGGARVREGKEDEERGDKYKDKQGGGAHGHADKGDEDRGDEDREDEDEDKEREDKDETSAEAYEPCVPGRVVFIERRAPCRARGCQVFQRRSPADPLAVDGVATSSCLLVAPHLRAYVCQSYDATVILMASVHDVAKL
jgi:hypothetical protein